MPVDYTAKPDNGSERLTDHLSHPPRYYPVPKDAAAEHIKDHVAFYKNKVVIKE